MDKVSQTIKECGGKTLVELVYLLWTEKCFEGNTKATKTYIQPTVYYGVMVYGSSTITTNRETYKIVKCIMRLIFQQRNLENFFKERPKQRICLAYEVLKQNDKNLRRQCNISSISKDFSMQTWLRNAND